MPEADQNQQQNNRPDHQDAGRFKSEDVMFRRTFVLRLWAGARHTGIVAPLDVGACMPEPTIQEPCSQKLRITV
jgi:hypothetical protein